MPSVRTISCVIFLWIGGVFCIAPVAPVEKLPTSENNLRGASAVPGEQKPPVPLQRKGNAVAVGTWQFGEIAVREARRQLELGHSAVRGD